MRCRAAPWIPKFSDVLMNPPAAPSSASNDSPPSPGMVSGWFGSVNHSANPRRSCGASAGNSNNRLGRKARRTRPFLERRAPAGEDKSRARFANFFHQLVSDRIACFEKFLDSPRRARNDSQRRTRSGVGKEFPQGFNISRRDWRPANECPRRRRTNSTGAGHHKSAIRQAPRLSSQSSEVCAPNTSRFRRFLRLCCQIVANDFLNHILHAIDKKAHPIGVARTVITHADLHPLFARDVLSLEAPQARCPATKSPDGKK